MRYELGFGDSPQTIEIEDGRVLDILLPGHGEAAADEKEEVERALSAPIGTAPLEELARGKHRAVIITSDITRPMPSRRVLPSVLNRLYQAGLSGEEITIVRVGFCLHGRDQPGDAGGHCAGGGGGGSEDLPGKH